MKVTFLGTGTSHGVPVIGCQCPVCRSPDARDKRSRCSVYVQSGAGTAADTALVIDTPPEFRAQCLAYGVRRVDAVLMTHNHADHLHGLDDLRIFSYQLRESVRDRYPERPPLPIYGNGRTVSHIGTHFDYIFRPVREGGGVPKLGLFPAEDYTADKPLTVGAFSCVPAPIMHGSMEVCGWVIRETGVADANETGFVAARDHNIKYPPDAGTALGVAGTAPVEPVETCGAGVACGAAGTALGASATCGAGTAPSAGDTPTTSAVPSEAARRGFAYLTDCNFVSDGTIELAHGVEHLVIDGLRVKPHNTHFGFSEALEVAARIAPRHVWFTHMNHEHSHAQIAAYVETERRRFPALCAPGTTVSPAHDGLVLEF